MYGKENESVARKDKGESERRPAINLRGDSVEPAAEPFDKFRWFVRQAETRASSRLFQYFTVEHASGKREDTRRGISRRDKRDSSGVRAGWHG